MTFRELENQKAGWIKENVPYRRIEWTHFDFSVLNNILYRKKAGRGNNHTVNDVFIMFDTETSKKSRNATYQENGQTKYVPVENHVVAWTISIRAFGINIVTLYGHKPTELCECIDKIMRCMGGDETIIYAHNLSYDWTFCRRFLFSKFGLPNKQLNTKSHYPILIQWENGLTIKDSLILAQRSINRWANDLDTEHKKAVGKWDYEKIRTQYDVFSDDELDYIECDTLAGVECLDKTREHLGKYVHSMPYTATGIPREDVRKIGKKNNARETFLSMCMTFEQYKKAEMVYHGGYTHANRHLIDSVLQGVTCRDFASSYPFCLLSEMYPMERFSHIGDKSVEYIIKNSDKYAFMFKLILIKPRLKNDFIPMPALQFSKCIKTINVVLDNGRVLCAEYLEIFITELDLEVIIQQYDFDKHICCDVEVARKGYLPRYLTDYIYKLFQDKTKLKGGDPVSYSLAKAKLNSVYGICVQKNIKSTIEEMYLTGEYVVGCSDEREIYETYLNNRNSILPYQWGVYCTAYAFRNLFRLGSCVDYEPDENGVCGQWVYSDTDSCYATRWNEQKLYDYNRCCMEKLRLNGYGAVLHNNREYWLGVAEFDGEYSEYTVQGSKRYCGRSIEDKQLHITVAGVPKSGVKCLHDDINNFTTGLVFDGLTTGKLTHTYQYVDGIYVDDKGNETGDSIDLTPCDYKLDSVHVVDWERVFTEEIEIQVYE